MRLPATEHEVDDSLGGTLLRRYEAGQQLVVDYALAQAILGLFHAWLTPVLVIAVLLLAKLVWDLARRWSFQVPRNPIAILGQLVNLVGAGAIALLAWLSCVVLGAVLPVGDNYALSAALMSGTWTLGASTNQFLMNGFLHQRSLRRSGPIDG
jgi:hypothetical protein